MPTTVIDPHAITGPPTRRGTLQLGTFAELNIVLAWASWALPLLFTEAVLQGKKVLAVR